MSGPAGKRDGIRFVETKFPGGAFVFTAAAFGMSLRPGGRFVATKRFGKGRAPGARFVAAPALTAAFVGAAKYGLLI